MKAYVIKRDDGKYKTPTREFLSDIYFADMFRDYETAQCYCSSDCKVVAVEIKEIQEQEEDNDCKCYTTGCDYCINYKCSRACESKRDCIYHSTKEIPKGAWQ